MQWSDIPFDPPRKTLRQFAGLWVLFFGGLACWQWLVRGHPAFAVVLAVLAVTVGPLGLVRPQAVRPIFVGWMVLAFPIGWTVSHLMLACLFYGVITPLGLLFRLAGRDVLCLRPRPDVDSYWTNKSMDNEPRSYFRQF
jgi:Saxitoxin biosynthesis operon protein SxtJ